MIKERMTFDPSAAALPESGIFGLPFSTDESKVIVLGVPFAATTSYGGGAEDGPPAIVAASRQVDLFDSETGRPYEAKIAYSAELDHLRELHAKMRPLAGQVIEVGGAIGDDARLQRALAAVNAAGDKVNTDVYEAVRGWHNQGKLVALVGGDHSTPFGAIRALAEAHPGLGVLHIDAHADLRVAYEGFTFSHASIMHNVATRIPQVSRIVQVGIRDFSEDEARRIASSEGRIVSFLDHALAEQKLSGVPWSQVVQPILDALPNKVYVSFDIDGLDPVLCPNTGTPVPGGLSYHEALYLLGGLVRAEKQVVGCDINEVAPGRDGSEWDANVGARLLYKLIGRMLQSQPNASR
jgi:agmatinase